MFVKHRSKPFELLSLEALFRRLKEPYRRNEVLLGEYKKFLAGYRGEKKVDYKLSLYPHNNFHIFQSLRLNNFSHYFQIDTLILTNNFICILEIKNIKGTLRYDSLQKQFIQIVEGKEKGYKDPILQAEAQKRNLAFWLENRNIHIPIETVVVSSNESTIIENLQQDPESYEKLIHSESLPLQLDKIQTKYTKRYLDKKKLMKTSSLLLSHHVDHKPSLLKKYGVTDNHLIHGVACPECGHYPMQRMYKKWLCPKCLQPDFTAHRQVVLSYFLLEKDTITNQECRRLLHIESPKTAYLLLNSMNLKQKGTTSARKYYAPRLEEFPQDLYVSIGERSIFSSGANW
ncbi:nuclease-related domain-containing protein [Lentibacillus sediminis]|uniref:nuclease-related domain-containing protein n=1 Tax=Lentibacillus sediminis TaxID=1940529 RepID=UPI000C1C196D|nr:nuclease-related domain-containing protein [Lentibacillus sediminis]